MMLARKFAEVILFSLIGALVTPFVAMYLAQFILDEVSQVYVIPLASVALIVLSFAISSVIKWVISSFMTVNMDHIRVMAAIFFLQLFICAIFLFFGLKFIYAVSVVLGSFVSLVVTIVKRPVTAMHEAEEKFKSITQEIKKKL